MANKKAYHGGAFFDAVGDDFSTLEKSSEIINADVLDAWFDPSPQVLKKMADFLPYILRTSPPTHSEGLIRTISAVRNIPIKNIIATGGSSDGMFAVFPNLLGKGDIVLILDPMYGEYSHIFENVIDVELHRFLLDKNDAFRVDVHALIRTVNDLHPKMMVIVNPNSPTGQYIELEKMKFILDSIPKDVLLVVDETYIDYIDSRKSLESAVAIYPNLIVIKSMSKVYALSGVRVGYVVADPVNLEKISPFIPPWSVSFPGQLAAVEALKDYQYYQGRYQETHQLRKEFIETVSRLPHVKIYDSSANFFLIEILDAYREAQDVVLKLREKNIFIRNCDSMSSQFKNNFLRIAVKNKFQNAKIIEALESIFL